MEITDVRAMPLRGATHDTGWSGGADPNELFDQESVLRISGVARVAS